MMTNESSQTETTLESNDNDDYWDESLLDCGLDDLVVSLSLGISNLKNVDGVFGHEKEGHIRDSVLKRIQQRQQQQSEHFLLDATDAFFEVLNKSDRLVVRSNVMMNELNPKFAPVYIPVGKHKKGSMVKSLDEMIFLTFYDWEESHRHQFLGHFKTSLRELKQFAISKTVLDLQVNHEKYGELSILNVSITRGEKTDIDYRFVHPPPLELDDDDDQQDETDSKIITASASTSRGLSSLDIDTGADKSSTIREKESFALDDDDMDDGDKVDGGGEVNNVNVDTRNDNDVEQIDATADVNDDTNNDIDLDTSIGTTAADATKEAVGEAGVDNDDSETQVATKDAAVDNNTKEPTVASRDLPLFADIDTTSKTDLQVKIENATDLTLTIVANVDAFYQVSKVTNEGDYIVIGESSLNVMENSAETPLTIALSELYDNNGVVAIRFYNRDEKQKLMMGEVMTSVSELILKTKDAKRSLSYDLVVNDVNMGKIWIKSAILSGHRICDAEVVVDKSTTTGEESTAVDDEKDDGDKVVGADDKEIISDVNVDTGNDNGGEEADAAIDANDDTNAIDLDTTGVGVTEADATKEATEAEANEMTKKTKVATKDVIVENMKEGAVETRDGGLDSAISRWSMRLLPLLLLLLVAAKLSEPKKQK